eukprot:GHVR01053758.1.p1 GENE.GHVR01053758.1~~GHVR01053758.1.p1  ORF type:complete len:103 (+),score=8.43 GHVR01053758.1:211-519(+)
MKLVRKQIMDVTTMNQNIFKRHVREMRQRKRDGWSKLNAERAKSFKGEKTETKKGLVNVVSKLGPFSLAPLFKDTLPSMYHYYYLGNYTSNVHDLLKRTLKQ